MACNHQHTTTKHSGKAQAITVDSTQLNPQSIPSTDIQKIGHIYLYGEQHATPWILEKELELWAEYYHNKGYRHLFVELPYYTAEYLNIWMREDTDNIIHTVYENFKGSSLYSESVLNFYKSIKKNCPDTIFHGIDVGHFYHTAGKQFLEYLNETNHPSAMYKLTEEAIKQGEIYYGKDNNGKKDHVYRENMMTQNFIREYNLLNGADIVGFFGSAHTHLEALDHFTRTVPCMANQLNDIYGSAIHTQNLTLIDTPVSVGVMTVNGKEYQASYFGESNISKILPKYQSREFWRLENAYEDFKQYPLENNVLPYTNYYVDYYRNSKGPFAIKIDTQNIYVIDYHKKDGSVRREYHRADGNVFKNKYVTNQIRLPFP